MIKIGFDFDGVISKNSNFKVKKAKEIYNIDLSPWQVTSNIINTFIPNKKIRDSLNSISAQTIHSSFVDKETISILQSLIDCGAELYIISRRGKSCNGIQAAQNTIDILGIRKFFKDIIFCETDTEKIEKIKEKKINLFIDDREKVIKNISNEDVFFPILFDEYDLIKRGILNCADNLIVINNLKAILNYVEVLSLIDKAISILVSKKVIDKSNKYEIISYLNNIVVKINNYYLKIYNGNSTIKDNELLLYKKIKNIKLFKEMIYQGQLIDSNKKFDFALFKQITGKTLDNFIDREKYSYEIAKSIFEFINCTAQIPCKNFGDIDEKFEGNYNNYLEYIFNFQHKTATTLYLEPSTRKYASLLYDLLVKYEKNFNLDKSYIIPVDLNFKNIIITDKYEVKIVDPGAVVAGPLEMSYGEFCAHSYGSPIYEHFEKLIEKSVDIKLVRIYAILLLLNILAFIVRNNITTPLQAKPFGNNKTFLELVDIHIKFLSDNK